MFADHKLFWMSFRQALLQIVNAIELELRAAGMMTGPTTSEIRDAWKKQSKAICVDAPKDSLTDIARIEQ